MPAQTIADAVAERDESTGPALQANPAFAPILAEQQSLKGRAAPVDVAALGSTLPDVELIDGESRSVRLSDVIGAGRSVVVFYRGVWCPYCNITLGIYQRELLPTLAELGVGLVAISPQRPDGSLAMTEAQSLTFTVLSDPGNQVAGALGILTSSGEDVLATQRQFGLDLTEVNADGTTTIPMPTVVIVDAGRIAWIDVHPDYTTRSEPKEILDALAALDR